MSVKVSITERDLGYTKIRENLRVMDGAYTKVGFPEDGSLKKGSANGTKKSKDQVHGFSELITVAAVHEFGAPTKNIPERPFFRKGLDRNRGEIKRLQEILLNKVLTAQMTTEIALKTLGSFVEKKIKDSIRFGSFKPLKDATKRRKGSSRPLIDTGTMRQSVQHVEVLGK